jgi:hypothetical protein
MDNLEPLILRSAALHRRFFEMMGMADEPFGPQPPASELELARLARRVERKLPPSYRAFLSTCNGWRRWSGMLDLLSTEQLTSGSFRAAAERFVASERAHGHAQFQDCLVIGISDTDWNCGVYLIDFRAPSRGGEHDIVRWDLGEIGRWPDMTTLLEEQVQSLEEMLAGPGGGGLKITGS